MTKAFFALAISAMLVAPASAINRYWDINGTAANTGTTANGTWSTAATNWNDDLSGTGGTITGWAVTTDTAVFSSGSGFTGNTTITASGTPVAAGVIIEEGQITLSGRADVNAGTIELKSGTTLVQASSGGATGTGFTVTAGGGFLISGNATLRQTNAANAGSFVATAATLAITNNSILTLDYTGTASPAPISIVQQAITGSGSIVKNGVGIIRMGVASTYSGSTTINAGELRLGGSAANRLPVATDLIINGGILNMGGATQNQTVASLSGSGGSIGGGGATLTISGTSGTTTYSGLLADTSFITATTAAGTTGVLNLTKSGASTQVLSGSNTYTGTSTVSAGTLGIGHNSALGTSAVTLSGGGLAAVGAARSIANNVTVTANSNVSGTENLTVTGNYTNSGGNRVLSSTNTGTTTLAGNVFLSNTAGTGRTAIFAGSASSNSDFVVSGNVADFNGAGTAGNIQVGNGSAATAAKLTLSGTNTHTGATNVSTGSLLNIGSAGALGASTLTTTGTGSFDNTTGAALSLTNNIALSGGSLTFVGTNDLSFGSNTVAISGAGRTITVSSGKLTVGSVTEDVGGRNFTKLGAGTLQVNGTISNSGQFNVNGGTMIIPSTGSVTAASNVSVNQPGTVLLLNGTIVSATTPVTVGAGATLKGNGSIAGSVTSNGSVAAGNSIGTLNIGASLTLTSGSFDWEFSSGTVTPLTPMAADLTNVGGGLDIAAAALLSVVNLGTNPFGLSPSPFINGTRFTVISYSGAWNNGTFGNASVNNSYYMLGGQLWRIKYDDTPAGTVNGGAYTSAVTLTAVPEASTFFVIGLGGVFAFAAVRLGKRMGYNVLNV